MLPFFLLLEEPEEMGEVLMCSLDFSSGIIFAVGNNGLGIFKPEFEVRWVLRGCHDRLQAWSGLLGIGQGWTGEAISPDIMFGCGSWRF